MTTKGFIKTLILLPILPVIVSPLLFMISLVLTAAMVLSGLFIHTTSVFDKPASAKVPAPKEMIEKISIKHTAPEIPDTLEGASVVDADWVKANYLKSKVKIFDVRGHTEYIIHIPGAIPYRWKDVKSERKLPAEKDIPIIVYGDDSKSLKSYEFTKFLVQSGYKKIYWFRDGFDDWKQKGYPVDDVFF